MIDTSSPFGSVVEKDFRIVAGSYLIDKGEVISEITDDFVGLKPDIGAYEYGLSPWIPGVNSVLGGESDGTVGVIDNLFGDITFKAYPNPLEGSDLFVDFGKNTTDNCIKIFNSTGHGIYAKSQRFLSKCV